MARSANVPRTARRAIAQCGKLLLLLEDCSPLDRAPPDDVEEGTPEPPERPEAWDDDTDADEADDCDEREARTEEEDAATTEDEDA